jgi:hypothetical protein
MAIEKGVAMKQFVVFVLCFAALSVFGQTAKVIPLSDKDSAERKSLEDQRAAIEQKIKDFDEQVKLRYTTVFEGDIDAGGLYPSAITTSGYSWVGCYHQLTLGHDAELDEERYQKCVSDLAAERAKNPPPKQRMYRRGWENGIIYSDDFKFIVPQEPTKYSPAQTWSCPISLISNGTTY